MNSGELTLGDPHEAPSLGSSRAQVLSVLRGAPTPLGVGEVAEQVGLHPNTARFHLDGLVEQGFVERSSEERGVPGRPRFLFAAVAGNAPDGRRSYRLLAEILAAQLARTDNAQQAALRAGTAWGHSIVHSSPTAGSSDARAVARQLTSTLDDIGFEPEAVDNGHERKILLRHCPFREVAERHQEVVCNVHLGLMRGVLERLGASLDVAGLDPFVEPGLCIARLT